MLFLSGISNIWWHCFAASTSNKKLIFIYIYLWFFDWPMSRRNAANVPETASFGWKQQSVLTGAIQGTRAVSFGSTGKLLGSPWSLQTIAALPGKAPSITKPALASKGWKWWKKKTSETHLLFFAALRAWNRMFGMFTDLLCAKMYCKTLWIEARAQIHRSC